jgi:hypothetical protein
MTPEAFSLFCLVAWGTAWRAERFAGSGARILTISGLRGSMVLVKPGCEGLPVGVDAGGDCDCRRSELTASPAWRLRRGRRLVTGSAISSDSQTWVRSALIGESGAGIARGLWCLDPPQRANRCSCAERHGRLLEVVRTAAVGVEGDFALRTPAYGA